MALDADSTSFTTWSDADVAERVRFGQSKFERMAQNQIVSENRRNQQDNAWSLGDDFRTHFSRPLSSMTGEIVDANFDGSNGTTTEDLDDHKLVLAIGGIGDDGRKATTVMQREPNKVPIEAEFRCKASVYDVGGVVVAGVSSYTGTGNPGARASPTGFANAALFITGSTSGTWDALTISGSALKSTTASISGTNYTSWDRLKMTLDGTDVKFYVHDGSTWVLKGTHNTDLGTLMATSLLCGLWVYCPGSGVSVDLETDYIIFRALENSLSA